MKSPLLVLTVVSATLLAVRLYAAQVVGFGDSEALYACWAAHPQPAYLDHPGLVGIVARAIGEGAIPTPERTHFVTAILATLVPFVVLATARALGAAERPALLAALVTALVPEIAVGLFALTPDLVLAPMWLGAIALAAYGLRPRAREGERASDPPRSLADGGLRPGASAALLAAGLVAGASGAAKISGVLLLVALAVAYAVIARSARPEAAAARTIWPWAGLGSGVIVLVPFALYEVQRGAPMLHHRLVETQAGAGLAIRNLGALFGGQLAYVSPVLAALAVIVARDLVRDRARDTSSVLLCCAFAIPLVPLVALSLWSPVAEPHWIAPALLALPLHAARRASLLPARWVRAGAAVAATFAILVHVWVLVPACARLVPADADPKLDIANELYGWHTALEAVRDEMKLAATPYDPEGNEVVVVGPHWTICAQLHAGLPGVAVGCATPIRDDFDDWLPREKWRAAANVLFVTDNRFGGDGGDQLPNHVPVGQSRIVTYRGGRVARTFELFLYGRTGTSRGDGAEIRRRLSERVENRPASEEVRDPPVRATGERGGAVAHRHEPAERGDDGPESSMRRDADRARSQQADEEHREHVRRADVEARNATRREDEADELEARADR
jgi:hypothetical protein